MMMTATIMMVVVQVPKIIAAYNNSGQDAEGSKDKADNNNAADAADGLDADAGE